MIWPPVELDWTPARLKVGVCLATTTLIVDEFADPVPVMVLARLAVDVRTQGLKLGAGLLQDAVRRVLVVLPMLQ